MYFRITLLSSPNKDARGRYVLCSHQPLHIGQELSCHVALPENDYEPQTVATILSHDEYDEWYLVRRSDHYTILINGTPLFCATTLHNGDVIELSDDISTTRLRFNTFSDGDYDPATGIVYKQHDNNILLSLVLLIVLIVIVLVGKFLVDNNSKTFNATAYNASVVHIATDTIYLLCDTIIDGIPQERIIETIIYPTVSTAFITNEGLLITARHCIEPWINDTRGDDTTANALSEVVRLANIAETVNRYEQRQRYKMRSHCVIYIGTSRRDCASTDFVMNKSRDLVIPLGSDSNPTYWRSIVPIAMRRDMELGDFAYLHLDSICGKFTLATIDDILAFNAKDNNDDHKRDIHIIGYTQTDDPAAGSSYIDGQCQEIIIANNTIPSCIRLTAAVSRGDSGAPVIAYINGEYKVIGIISKGDTKAQNTAWAVPITEVTTLVDNNDYIPTDTTIYRR